MKLTTKLLILFSAILLLTTGCNRRKTIESPSENIFEEAVFIKGEPRGEGNMLISIINPWDTTTTLAEYNLMNTGVVADKDATANAISLQLPLKRLIVYTSVHAALLTELGYIDAIVGVADAEYIKTPEIRQRLADGRIVDIGSSIEPTLEKIISLQPDAILLSPFQNAGHGVVDKANIPVIECADYMETTPLGRAEWSKFYAMLVEGIADSNNATFNQSCQQYKQLVAKAATYKEKPRVITEMQNKGTWIVPGGGSYAAKLLTDAGAEYPFSDNKTPGSISLNYEKVYMAAENTDFWLIKTYGNDLTLTDIAKNQPFNKNFWAYKHQGIFNANTMKSNLYEETPFHPDRLLADYVAIFHHTGDSLRYYSPVK